MPVVRLGESRWAWDAKSGCRRSALGRIPAGAGGGAGDLGQRPYGLFPCSARIRRICRLPDWGCFPLMRRARLIVVGLVPAWRGRGVGRD